MQNCGKRWVLAVLVLACLVAVAGAAWAGPSPSVSSPLEDSPSDDVQYETLQVAPSADTYIYGWDADSNYGDDWAMYLRSGDLASPLLQFSDEDIPVLPNVTIAKGTLKVYVNSRTNARELTLAVCQVLREWDESSVTWNQATAGDAWQTAGCNGSEDRAGAIGAPVTLDEEGEWIDLDVTDLVRAWYTGEAENYGVILKSMPGGSVTYEMVSSDSMHTELHPYLEITYGLIPTPEPTIPPSPTPTPLPLLDVTKTGPQGPLEVSGDEVIDYTIVVANNRDYAFSGVTVTDTLPLGTEFLSGSVGASYHDGFHRVTWSIPTLGSGQAVTLTLSLGVPSWVKADGNVVNVVRAGCVECWEETGDYYEIPVNIIHTPTPTIAPTSTPEPVYGLALPLVNKQSYSGN